MNPFVSEVQDVPANELTTCLQWLLGKMRVERAQWVVAQLSDRVEKKRISDIYAVKHQQHGRIKAAAIAIAQHPRAASLLAIGGSVADDAAINGSAGGSRFPIDAVFARLDVRLAAEGTQYLQASSETIEHGRQLRRLGFDHLADLVFLVLDSEQFSNAAEPEDVTCRFESVGEQEARIAIASEVAAATFLGTRDCPRLSDFRSPAEIVAGYRLAAGFDPRLWQILTVDNEPAGCLFLTQHRSAEAVNLGSEGSPYGAMEISYMGLTPEHRGQRLGQLILAEAVRIAEQHQAPRMVLAVDRENSPAIALYRRNGWTEAAQESAWGIKIGRQITS